MGIAIFALAAAQAVAPLSADYLNPMLPPATRAADLVHRMTTAEKISQMMSQAAAIPRLGIPHYNWWSEALHGIAKPGKVTVFPQVIGLGASFDPNLVHEMAVAISDEARARWNYQRTHGDQGWDQGLDFWAPNINIFRDPRWGRGQETYGEDPFLTARMAVAYVTGIQGSDPRHLKAIATPKHYAVHSGPDPQRHTFDAIASKRDMWLTYLPAFQAAITEGGAWSIMSSYNRVNGTPSSANSYLLGDVLRQRWGFPGYVVSDCGAIDDIVFGHHFVKTPPEAAAKAVIAGCDLECGNLYQNLAKSLTEGLISEAALDTAVERLMEARVRMGMFDKTGPYDKIPMSVVESREHRALARRLADESIVLLKNGGHTLPLSPSVKTLAVIGPNADSHEALLGNYNGMSKLLVTALDGIKASVSPATKVLYAPGSGINSVAKALVVPATELKVTGEYFPNKDFSGTPALVRVDDQIGFDWGDNAPDPLMPQTNFSVRWTGTLTPSVTGDYMLGVRCDDGMRLYVDDKLFVDNWSDGPARVATAPIHLIAGEAHKILLQYYQNAGEAVAQLVWQPPTVQAYDEAVDAAKQADAVVMVLGITPNEENEEHDRADIALPAVQQELFARLKATGKPIVVVYMNGGPVSSPTIDSQADAIVEAWYPGEEGGNAIADVLFGRYNPAGRLPVTIWHGNSDLLDFADYDNEGRGYRFSNRVPAYPFGYGLSYATFAYRKIQAPAKCEIGQPLSVSVQVENTSDVAGEEVVQVYLSHKGASEPMPLRELKAFRRVQLGARQVKTVRLTLVPADMAVVRSDTRQWQEPEPIELFIGGSQPTPESHGITVRLAGEAKVLPLPKSTMRG